MKYLHVLIFLITHDLTELKEFWRVEFMKTEKTFKWRRLFRALKRNINKFIFWYRLAYFMKRTSNAKQKIVAEHINQKLIIKYNIDIALDAEIGIGINIWHLGIVITERAKIGNNLQIGSNVVIGFKDYTKKGSIKMGNNVMLGTKSMIFGQNINIGNNVKVGAMSFINKDIPDNCTVLTKKELILNVT